MVIDDEAPEVTLSRVEMFLARIVPFGDWLSAPRRSCWLECADYVGAKLPQDFLREDLRWEIGICAPITPRARPAIQG
jgi:hypothetical protein